MEPTSIVVAVLSLLGTFGGSLLGIRESNKIVELRLNDLEKKVDKHNNVVERVAIAERDIKSNCRRINELEDVLPRASGR